MVTSPSSATSSAPQPLVRLTRNGFVAEISLAHPPLNLVTRQMLQDLHQVLLKLTDEPARCLILHQGEARAFCAGSDMREFETVRATAVNEKILYEEYVLRQLAQLPFPTLAALDGAALGGGFELALACDLRIASEQVRVGLTECQIGGLAGSGAARLTRLAGPGRAAELLFTGKVINAVQAHAWGLVNELAPSGTALAHARTLAEQIAARGPLSNTFAKQIIAAAQDGPAASALAMANQLQERIFRSDDLLRGAQAFFDKAPAQFRGR